MSLPLGLAALGLLSTQTPEPEDRTGVVPNGGLPGGLIATEVLESGPPLFEAIKRAIDVATSPADAAIATTQRTVQKRGYYYEVLELGALERFHVMEGFAGDRLYVVYSDAEWIRVIPARSRGVREPGIALNEDGCYQLDSVTEDWVVWLPARTDLRDPVEQVHILITTGQHACLSEQILQRPVSAPGVSRGADVAGGAPITIAVHPRRLALHITNSPAAGTILGVGTAGTLSMVPGIETGTILSPGETIVIEQSAHAAWQTMRTALAGAARMTSHDELRLPPPIPL